MMGPETTNGFEFKLGPFKGKSPREATIEYLRQTQAKLRAVPKGHELREVLDAVTEELAARGDEPSARQPGNPEVFRVPAPLPAAELARRAAKFAREQQEPASAPQAGPQRPAALMPCGHPTGDLKPVQGSWRGACSGCERLEQYRMAIASGMEPAEVLSAFEAEIRGYKKPEDA